MARANRAANVEPCASTDYSMVIPKPFVFFESLIHPNNHRALFAATHVNGMQLVSQGHRRVAQHLHSKRQVWLVFQFTDAVASGVRNGWLLLSMPHRMISTFLASATIANFRRAFEP